MENITTRTLRSPLRIRNIRLLAGLVLALFTVAAPAHQIIESEIAYFTEQLKFAPEDAALFVQRGDLYRQHQELAAAASDFRQALELEPRLADAHAGLGRVLLAQGNPGMAMASLNRALAHDPQNIDALVARASVHNALGNHLAAAADYLDVIDLAVTRGRTGPEFYLATGQAYADAGPAYLGSAVAILDQGISRLGNLPVLQLAAIDLERGQGDHAAALRRIDAVLPRVTRRESWLSLRADILLETGMHDAARKDLLEALQAIDSLPSTRRAAPATQELAGSIRSRLETLDRDSR